MSTTGCSRALHPYRLNGHGEASFEVWRNEVRQPVLAAVAEFVTDKGATDLRDAGVDIAQGVLVDFAGAGKCVRSTFVYLGWLCGARPDNSRNNTALRAGASFELLHTFALLQDDVMDGSALRGGRPSAHFRFARWHAERGLGGSAERFGASAAVLLGDLCLMWAGQFADLVNDAGAVPTLDAVLDVTRRKSGDYTVRRPLEIGADLAGCPGPLVDLLGHYGGAVGQAFQLRDELLGVFGAPAVTGKPSGGDLVEQTATSVVVAAHHLADVSRWRALILATGAVQWIEETIADRLTAARQWIEHARVDDSVRRGLESIATACGQRAA